MKNIFDILKVCDPSIVVLLCFPKSHLEKNEKLG